MKKERERNIERWKIWSEMKGSRRRWRRLLIDSGIANNGATVVESPVVSVGNGEMGSHHGDEGERRRERKREKEKKRERERKKERKKEK